MHIQSAGLTKTGLQPVSRAVERVHYLGDWSGGSTSLYLYDTGINKKKQHIINIG